MDSLKRLGEMLVVFSKDHERCLGCEKSWADIRNLLKSDKDLQMLLCINWNKRRL